MEFAGDCGNGFAKTEGRAVRHAREAYIFRM